MEDIKIIELLFARNEGGIRHMDDTYGHRLFVLADNIVRNDQAAEESASDTYLAAVNVFFFQCDCCYRIWPESVPGRNG